MKKRFTTLMPCCDLSICKFSRHLFHCLMERVVNPMSQNDHMIANSYIIHPYKRISTCIHVYIFVFSFCHIFNYKYSSKLQKPEKAECRYCGRQGFEHRAKKRLAQMNPLDYGGPHTYITAVLYNLCNQNQTSCNCNMACIY